MAPGHGVITAEDEQELRLKPRGFFADQFEVRVESMSLKGIFLRLVQNKSNFDAHFEGTGPEIWRQTSGRVNAFVSGAGTINPGFS